VIPRKKKLTPGNSFAERQEKNVNTLDVQADLMRVSKLTFQKKSPPISNIFYKIIKRKCKNT